MAADQTEYQRHQNNHPDIAIAEIRPQQGGQNDGEKDQRTAHGWRTGLREMAFRAELADRLPQLLLNQAPDEPWTEQQE